MTGADERYDQVWRHSPVAVVVIATTAVGCVVFAIAVSVMGQAVLASLLWLWAIGCAVGGWRFVAVPYVAATPSGVVVQNALLRYTFAWSEIADIRVGNDGLQIVRTDGTSVLSSAVQQPNIARWTGWRTRSDEVAAELMNRRFVYLRRNTAAAD